MGLHKISRGQDIQMKRKRGSGQVQTLGNLAGGQALGGMADEQAKNLQSRFLRKRGKGIESGRYIHIFGMMEMLFGRAAGVKERNPDRARQIAR